MAAAWGLASGLSAGSAAAAPVAVGYSTSLIPIAGGLATGDVVVAGGALFVGVSDGSFQPGGNWVVRIDAGGQTVIGTGFEFLSGFAYDAQNDRLIVGDNGASRASLYAIDDPIGRSSAQAASGAELLPGGSTPFVSDLILDPADATRIYWSSAAGAGAGSVQLADLVAGSSSPVQSGLDYAGGLASDGSSLFFGDTDATTFAGDVFAAALPGGGGATPLASLAAEYDLEIAADGALLVTAGSQILRIDPTSHALSVVASDVGGFFPFYSGLFVAGDDLYVIDGGGAPALYRLAAVPEPALLALLLPALAAGALGRRRA